MEVENKYISIKDYTHGNPSESNFQLVHAPLPLVVTAGSEDVIVKNLYVSVDPYQINRMKKCSSTQATTSFATQLVPGKEIDAFGVGIVVASGNPNIEKDDLVTGVLTWAEYTIVKPGTILNKISSATGFPLSYHLSVLGPSGLAAYAGFYEVCKPRKGDKVFVSSAAGSVGNLVGQFAKLYGCYVVGCAGSDEKVLISITNNLVNVLKEKLGFDDAFNYKEEPDLKMALKRCFPGGIDIYFDNVGAEMLEAAVANMNPHGRVAVCGVIAEYTNKQKRAAPDMLDVIYKRITIQGFLAYDYLNVYSDLISTASGQLQRGEIHVLEDISDGIESIPSAFAGLFRGDNVGKKIVKVADPIPEENLR